MGVSLTQVCEMNKDHMMAAKWLSENVADVLQSLDRLHVLEIGNDVLYGLLCCKKRSVDEKIKLAIKFLENECE